MENFKEGRVDADDVLKSRRELPHQDLGYAKVDHHRSLRKGFPEVVFGQGKTHEQILEISKALLGHSEILLITRVGREAFENLHSRIPDAVYHEKARAVVVDRRRNAKAMPGVAVISAGTADIPVAEEAAVTAEAMGSGVERLYDVGVAGVHRLLSNLSTMQSAKVIVAVAGMEGALPSVGGGLVSVPVIAVPTSVGYGASFQGIAPLLTMLNTCAPGVCVVNIDNGFGAGYLAAIINKAVSGGTS